MKEIYLAKDASGLIFGYDNMPSLDSLDNRTWMPNQGNAYPPSALFKLGIDVTKFPLTHETPIKIRAVWEVVND